MKSWPTRHVSQQHAARVPKYAAAAPLAAARFQQQLPGVRLGSHRTSDGELQ